MLTSCWTRENVAVIMACEAISYAIVQLPTWAARSEVGLTVARSANTYMTLCLISSS